MDLQNVPNMVATCLVLHNMCIVHRDSFIVDWVREAERDLQASTHVVPTADTSSK